jgi:hypothetical protein
VRTFKLHFRPKVKAGRDVNMLDAQSVVIITALVGMACGGLWKLTRVEKALSDKIEESKEDVERKQEEHSRNFGETIAAIRQKVADVELYGANNYVRRDSFYKVQETISQDIKSLGAQMEARFVRLEAKIDTKTSP